MSLLGAIRITSLLLICEYNQRNNHVGKWFRGRLSRGLVSVTVLL